jgi:hypothetical protein
MCKGRAEPLDPKEDRRKLYPEIALRNAMQQDFDPEYGRVSSIYAVRAGEDKKITSFPIGQNLVLVSNYKKGAHGRIIGKILKLIAAD